MPRPLLLATALVAALATSSLSARPHVWKGTASNLFSDHRNWQGGSPAGDPAAELVFAEAVRQALVNDLDGLTIRRMTFEVDGYTIEGQAIALIDGAEIESRDAVISAELRLNGEVVPSPRGGLTHYSRDEDHATTPAIRSDAEPSGVITFDPSGNSVDARVTPGAETAWLILSRFSGGFINQGHLQSDTDRDGVVRWVNLFGPAKRKVCVIDEASGEIHVAISDGSPVERGTFAAKFLRDTNGDFSWIQLPAVGSGGLPEILWVRPGVGTWSRIPSPLYGARLSTDSFTTFLFNVHGMLPIGASPAPPAGVEPGDYFVSMSFSRFDNGTFYGGRVDEPLANAERAETQVVLNGASMNESVGNAFFFVLRFGSTDRDTRIEYEISDADAGDGVAYPPASGTLVIRRGEVSGRIEYPIAQDAVYTGDTSIRVDFKSVSGGTLVGASSTLASLTDDDPLPVISVVDKSVPEGDAGTRDVTVELKRTGGTLVPSTAWWALPNRPRQSVVFAPGETTREIVLQVEGDTVPEPNEEIRIELEFPLGFTQPPGTLMVVDDDAAGLTARSITVDEGSNVARVVVALDSVQAVPVTVKYQTSHEGTATPDADYSRVTGTLTFAPGETEKQVAIPILQDLFTEASESFELVLFDPSPSLIIRQSARITILDDGDFPVSFSMEDTVVTENSSAVLFLSAAPEPQADIRLGTRVVSGSASAGIDFSNLVVDEDRDSAHLVMRRGSDTFLFVEVFRDDLVEGDETFVVEIFDVDDPSHVLASATVTVKDENSLLPILAIGDGSASEGNIASFPVTLSQPSIFLVSFRVRTVGDTAESNADFESVSQIYTFMPGETSMTVEVPTLEDSLSESHETFAVELLNPANARTEDAVARGRIFDDDDPEAPMFGVSNVSVSEGAGVARFTVTLGGALSKRASIGFGTADGTAVAGEDYMASHGELTFEPGETSKTVEVALVNDARFEQSETFAFRLTNGPEATATIVNDDGKGRSRSVRH